MQEGLDQSIARHQLQGNAMAPCLPLFEALATGRGEVSLALGPGLALGVEIVALECRG